MSGSWQEKLDLAIDHRFAQMVDLRRHLHRFPETSGNEEQTSLRLYQLLGNEGFGVRMGPEGCGVLAELPADDETAVRGRIAVRADIDALYIHDAKQVEYRSQHEGIMHACGHDAHTALVFGTIAALNDLRRQEDLPCPLALRAIFQPAEETVSGARAMIGVGALDGVDAILATHVDPARRLGTIGIRTGVLTASCDEVRINITGSGGHAARPHEASDPIAAAAQLINSLYLFIPRATDSQDAAVVTIGHIAGGDNANVIPEQVHLHGTIRTLKRAVRQDTFDHIRRLANGVGQTTDTEIEVQFGVGCGSVINDADLVDRVVCAASDVLGPEGVELIPRPSMGSEDFAFYLEHVPGAMLRLGCTSERFGGSPLHTTTFDIDEQALRVGARILGRAIVDWSISSNAAETT